MDDPIYAEMDGFASSAWDIDQTIVASAVMSRRRSPLVSYASSDEEGTEVEPHGPARKKR